MKSNVKKNRRAGFSLIELTISMAMVVILAASTIQIARFSDTQKNLTLATDQVRASIRTAQSYALSIPNSGGAHVCSVGFRVVSSSTYEVFYTAATNAEYATNPGTACSTHLAGTSGAVLQAGSLPNGITFTTASGNVNFKVPYGEVLNSRSFIIQKDASTSRTITINASGMIN